MVFLIICAVVIAVAILYGFIKAVNAVFNPLIRWTERKRDRLQLKDNPYVQAHMERRWNDKMYDEYLDWLDQTNGSLPIEKLKSKEEIEFENEVGLKK